MKTLKYLGVTFCIAIAMTFLPAALAQQTDQNNPNQTTTDQGTATTDQNQGAATQNQGAQTGTQQGTASAQTQQGGASAQATAPSGTARTGRKLPRTASEFPLMGMAGLLAAAGALTARKFARQS